MVSEKIVHVLDKNNKKYKKYFCECGELMARNSKKCQKCYITEMVKRNKQSPTMLGKKLGKQAKEKISKANKGKLIGAKNPMFGKTHTPEARRKISLNNYKRNMKGKNNPFYGKKHSKETIKKIKAKITPERMEKMRQLGYKKPSLQTRQKIRKARLKQKIPFKDTSIEVAMQNELKKRSIKFRTHEPIMGQPDIFIEPNICIFCDGNYWHSFPDRIKRDKEVNHFLINNNFIVLRFWEHEIKKNVNNCINNILNNITLNEGY